MEKLAKIQGMLRSLVMLQKTLNAALLYPYSDISRDAAIYRFSQSFELACRLMDAILQYKGIDNVYSRQEILHYAAREEMIHTINLWLLFLKDRHLTRYIYHEPVAEKIFNDLSAFNTELTSFIKNVKNIG